MLICSLFICLLPGINSFAQFSDELEKGFLHPPKTAQPLVFWHWMNGNVTKSGIQEDLIDMKRCGIGGVMLFNAALGGSEGPVRYGSDLFYDYLHYTLHLCDSLGISFINTNCPGWATSGGPWIDADKAMKILTWSETEVKGGQRQRITLPLSNHNLDYYREIAIMAVPSDRDKVVPLQQLATVTYSDSSTQINADNIIDNNDKTGVSIPATKEEGFITISFDEPVRVSLLKLRLGTGGHIFTFDGSIEYSNDGVEYRELRDFNYYGRISNTTFFVPFIATRAKMFRIYVSSAYRTRQIPTDIREIGLSTQNRLENCEAHIGENISNINRNSTIRDDGQAVIPGYVDLTDSINAQGELIWNVPSGDWTILRMGYTVSKHTNHPAPPEATGLEVDKLDPKAVAYHFYQANSRLIEMSNSEKHKSVNGIIIDSYEAGLQNWSHNFLQDFRDQHGYDLKSYLPILTGRVMNSTSFSASVLWDYRHTISTLLSKNFYGTTKTLANWHGMKLYVEPYGNFFDLFNVVDYVDIPMAEYWMHFGEDNVKKISSIAHTKGKKIIGAEAFTALPQFGGAFQDTPEYLKATGDLAFTDGVNLNILHSYVHQPDKTGPGYTLGHYGSHFGKLNTWWKYAPTWISYLSRIQFLMQQGQFVGDICVIHHDDIEYLADETLPAALAEEVKGYDYDFCSQNDILRLKFKNGKLNLPNGQQYSLLLMPPNRFIQLDVLRHIRQLVHQGAIIIGSPPVTPSGLISSKKELDDFFLIVSELWGDEQEGSVQKRTYGKGKVYRGEMSIRNILAENSILPDFEAYYADSLRYIHRRTKNVDIYFISNQEDKEVNPVISMRISGKQPEIWNPITGQISEISKFSSSQGISSFALNLAPYGSICIVFRKNLPTDNKWDTINKLEAQPIEPAKPFQVMTINSPWRLSFLDGRGAPDSMIINDLKSWTEFSEQDIKNYSGTASYQTIVHLPDHLMPLSTCLLKLDKIYDIAAIKINGQESTVIWTKPYQTDITRFLRKGKNTVEIEISNRWINRLIGDQQATDTEPYTFCSWTHYSSDSDLIPSGLVGPVSLEFYK